MAALHTHIWKLNSKSFMEQLWYQIIVRTYLLFFFFFWNFPPLSIKQMQKKKTNSFLFIFTKFDFFFEQYEIWFLTLLLSTLFLASSLRNFFFLFFLFLLDLEFSWSDECFEFNNSFYMSNLFFISMLWQSIYMTTYMELWIDIFKHDNWTRSSLIILIFFC